MINITTTQGPSANNQTSQNHTLDSNQRARQPNKKDIMESEGLDIDSDIDFISPSKK